MRSVGGVSLSVEEFWRCGAANATADESDTIQSSAASAWKISTKVRLGKLPEAQILEIVFLATIEEAGYAVLPIKALEIRFDRANHR